MSINSKEFIDFITLMDHEFGTTLASDYGVVWAKAKKNHILKF